MDWVKLSARYYLDPAVVSLDDAAEVMFTRALAYAGDQETGGFIPAGIMPALCRRRRYETALDALIAAGLLRRARGGYTITRWHEWQSELEAIVRRRSADRDRKRRERERASAAHSTTLPELDQSSDGHSSQVNGVSRDTSTDVSDPYIEKREEELHPRHPPGASPPRKRGCRLPDDFAVTPEMVAWARTECPHVDGRAETAKFIDYWQAATGRNATKLDWVATWRNWMRRAAERPPPRGRHHRQAETDELFDRAMQRARARDAQEANGDPRRDGHPDPLRPRMLPAAGD